MNPEELLAQIRTLLEAYLDMGEDTPVAAEARVLASAIDQAAGEAPAGGPPQFAALGVPL